MFSLLRNGIKLIPSIFTGIYIDFTGIRHKTGFIQYQSLQLSATEESL